MRSPPKSLLLVTVLIGFGCPSSLLAWSLWHKIEAESVMTTGMIIEATNTFGRIRIEASEGTRRIFFWNGAKESVRLRRRPSRWQGSFGLYSPGGGPRVHLIVEEGQQHFCSECEASEWLLRERDRMGWACTSNGLVVGWYRAKKPDSDYWAVVVVTWQILINGHEPTRLEAMCDHSVVVTGSRMSPDRETKHVFVPSAPQLINGRLYSGKAQDLMAESGVSPDDVEDTIAHGKPLQIAAPKEGWKYFCRRTLQKMLMVIVDEDGRVIFIQT